MADFPVRFGLQTGQQNTEWADLRALWQNAETWGYDSLWAFDHFYPIFTDPAGPCLEGWTTLSALAQATERVRIGHLVNGNTYRHPTVLAKMAASLDQISDGRLNLGIGAGWFELEHESLGIEFKTVRGRLEALEESLQILKGMFAGERVDLAGRHYEVKGAFANPQPIQGGSLPIMIGGEGRKILLRIVAEYANMWNAFGSPSHMKELIDVIKRHGDTVQRDPADIEKTVMMPLCYTEDKETQDFVLQLLGSAFELDTQGARDRTMIGSRSECIDKIAAYNEIGVTHFIFMLMAPYDHAGIQAFAEEVIPDCR